VDARSALRTLSGDPQEWVLLTVSLALSLNMQAGIVAWTDSTLALVESDISLSEALGSMSLLAPFATTLRKLSRDGRLCFPLSGRPFASQQVGPGSTAAPGYAVRACVDALRECQERGISSAIVSWIDSVQASDQALPLAITMPIEFPSVPSLPSRDTLCLEIQQALGEGQK
jgi:hypothetical protein